MLGDNFKGCRWTKEEADVQVRHQFTPSVMISSTSVRTEERMQMRSNPPKGFISPAPCSVGTHKKKPK